MGRVLSSQFDESWQDEETQLEKDSKKREEQVLKQVRSKMEKLNAAFDHVRA